MMCYFLIVDEDYSVLVDGTGVQKHSALEILAAELELSGVDEFFIGIEEFSYS